MASRRLVVLLLVATTLAGACGGGDDDPKVERSQATTTTAAGDTSTSAPPEEAAGLTIDGAPAPVQASEARPIGAAPAPPAAGTPAVEQEAESTQAFRPAPGTYRYEGESGGEPAQTTIKVEDIAQERLGFRVRQTLLDAEGLGQVRDILWGTERVSIDRQHNTSGTEESGKCDWDPDFVQYLLPLEVGRRWEINSVCRSTDPTRPSSLTEKSTVRVTERRRATVAGVTTTVFVLERNSSTTLGAPGVTVGRTRRSTELWSPRYGVIVEESGTFSTETPGEDRPPTPFRYKLLNLRPS